MLSFWPRDKRVGRQSVLALLGGALVALSSLASAGPYSDLNARIQNGSDKQVMTGLRSLAGDDSEADSALKAGPKAARAYVDLRANLEGAPTAKPPRIATSGDDRIANSWLARAFDRLRFPKFDNDRAPISAGMLGDWVTPLMWAFIGGLLALAVYLLARYVRLPGLRRKAKPMASGEPERTADAWLQEANALASQGRFREAVRGLYVAGLLRIDEAGVARFDPHQTNWEHLRRIESSPKRPEGVDVRTATGLFDRCWYGHLPSSANDATAMRNWYETLTSALKGATS